MWESLWKIVLLFTLVGYSLLAITVVIGGVKDITAMLRDLRDGVDEDGE